MNELQKAGFVKRALELGFTKTQAESLCKEAWVGAAASGVGRLLPFLGAGALIPGVRRFAVDRATDVGNTASAAGSWLWNSAPVDAVGTALSSLPFVNGGWSRRYNELRDNSMRNHATTLVNNARDQYHQGDTEAMSSNMNAAKNYALRSSDPTAINDVKAQINNLSKRFRGGDTDWQRNEKLMNERSKVYQRRLERARGGFDTEFSMPDPTSANSQIAAGGGRPQNRSGDYFRKPIYSPYR